MTEHEMRDSAGHPGRLRERLKVLVRGAVQGVGFRPFIHRLAHELQLAGWVQNSPQGVFIEVEGPRASLERFLLQIESGKPARSFIQSLEAVWLDPIGYGSFEIRPSDPSGARLALVLPDIATCPDCLHEIFDPGNRRHRYPFTNCTHCGPRFTIIESLPYDRANTSMRRFAMCPRCQAEYDDPRDRRFHAQPNACAACGPHLELWDRQGRILAGPDEALGESAEAIRQGRIVAVKGLGGFHLMVAAHHDEAIQRLRRLKHREEKPLAVMAPSLEQAKEHCCVDEFEERLLRSPEAPIVLLRRQPRTAGGPHRIAEAVAPANPQVGVMLPATPLHHLLLAELGFAVVATSGNLSDEPICTDEQEALDRLGGIAELFLVHNRPIVRHVDDSIVRVMMNRELVMRRARGYAPLPVHLHKPLPQAGYGAASAVSVPNPASPQSPAVVQREPVVLAVGAHLKNAVALGIGPQVFISQHIGDLENTQAMEAFTRVIADLQQLYEARPEVVVADAHPGYLSTQFARRLAARTGDSSEAPAARPRFLEVQHHYAHVLSCMAENDLAPPVFGVAWDGTGYGPDETIWGGEFLRVTDGGFERFGHLRTFPLPGGDLAVKEPRRCALGLLEEMFGEQVYEQQELATLQAFRPPDLLVIRQALQKRLNAPATSSMGRLFDAVASLMGLRQITRFEGQAAMELEFALEAVDTEEAYPLSLREPAPQVASAPRPHGTTDASARSSGARILDWEPLVRALLADVQGGARPGIISARFHNALAEGIVLAARQAGESCVVLSGGCFQNKYLTERAVRRLQAAGFRPYWHQRIPPNDGGIALGQVVAAVRAAEIAKRPCV